MADISFDQLLKSVQSLTNEQKAILMEQLQEDTDDHELTREELIAELEALRAAGAFDNVESLRNTYYSPETESLSAEQLLADLHKIATEWEQELDEFYGDES